jgi:D-lactate dehydrogenase
MKVLVYSTHGFEKEFLLKDNQKKHQLFFSKEKLNENTVDLSKDFDAISLFSSDNANAKILQELKNKGVKYISLRSVGYDHVDIPNAKINNIKVANVPAYSPQAIAEHAIALLMTLNRKIVEGQKLMRKNDYRLDKLIGFNLHKKTVGIIGTGKIGAAFCRIMKGFGCNLLAYDIYENPDLINETGITYTSLQNLCNQSDVVAVFCPLTTQTKYLFNKKTFDWFKPNAIFINVARGGIVNTRDMLDALNEHKFAQAGLDVYENEKPIFFKTHKTKPVDELFDELKKHPKVLTTGHQAFLTQDALTQIAQTTIDNLDQWEKLGKSENEI